MIRYLAMVAMIVVAAGLAWQQSHRPPRAVDQSSEMALQQWPHITPAQVQTIHIHHGKVLIQLNRHDENWMVVDTYGEVAANQESVSRLLRDVTNMRPQRVLSSNPKNFARFRLTDDTDRLTLDGKGDTVLLDLLVGKPGTDLISTTVRQVGKDAIINVNRSLAWQLGRTPASWHAPEAKKSTKP